MKTMDKIMIIVAVFLIMYVAVAIYIFMVTGSEMTALTAGVFAFCGGEYGIMGIIKSHKIRYEDRQWIIEDRKEHE